MDFYVYAESYEKPTRSSVTNECQTVEELARTVAHKLGFPVTRGLGNEELPYELGKFESGVVLNNKEKIRDVLHEEESLVIRELEIAVPA